MSEHVAEVKPSLFSICLTQHNIDVIERAKHESNTNSKMVHELRMKIHVWPQSTCSR